MLLNPYRFGAAAGALISAQALLAGAGGVSGGPPTGTGALVSASAMLVGIPPVVGIAALVSQRAKLAGRDVYVFGSDFNFVTTPYAPPAGGIDFNF